MRGSEGCGRSSITMCQRRSRITSRTRGTSRTARTNLLTTICSWVVAGPSTREPRLHSSRIRTCGTHRHPPRTPRKSRRATGGPAAPADSSSRLSARNRVQRAECRRDLRGGSLPAGTRHQGRDKGDRRRGIEIMTSLGSNLQRRRRNLQRSWSITTQMGSAPMSSSFR